MADDAPKPADFFLPGRGPSGDSEVYDAPPARQGVNVTPLIDAVAAFSAMEAAIAAAKSSVLLSFWVLNPLTPVQNKTVRQAGAATWGDLLYKTAARGVTVRVLLTDFDSLLQKPLHRLAWQTHDTLLSQAARLSQRSNLEVLVSLHPAFAQIGVQGELKKGLDALVAQAHKAKKIDDVLRHHPGAWAWLEYDSRLKKVTVKKDGPALIAHIASHHQKQCIVDETLAFCGGLDVNTGRVDTPDHDQQAWHDVHVQLDALAALDIHHNFVARWNAEADAYRKFIEAANKTGMPVTLPVHTVTPLARATTAIPAIPATLQPATAGKSWVQIQRTLSREANSMVPRPVVKDIALAYEKAIGQARRYIYIENQYVRSPVLREWISARARAVRNLVVIIVLPVAPEEVADKIDPITNQGLLRQRELLEGLAQELGPRLGMYSMVQRKPAADPKHKTNSFSSTQVYVHSKVMLIDDVWATIGSANANPRSFLVDTELNASFYDPEVVTRLRLTLWDELLGSPPGLTSWKPADFAAEWASIARTNAKAAPKTRKGFIVPHDPAKFPGASSFGLPNELVDLLDGSAAPPDLLPA